jgi:hypothetical protein
VDEYLWRVLAMRQPNREQADAQMAMMIARYDRAIARALVEPIASEARAARLSFWNSTGLYAAAAAIDPKWAASLVEALPEDPDLKMQGAKNYARLVVAGLLGRTGERRFKKLQHSYLYLWIPDVEDIDTDD